MQDLIGKQIEDKTIVYVQLAKEEQAEFLKQFTKTSQAAILSERHRVGVRVFAERFDNFLTTVKKPSYTQNDNEVYGLASAFLSASEKQQNEFVKHYISSAWVREIVDYAEQQRPAHVKQLKLKQSGTLFADTTNTPSQPKKEEKMKVLNTAEIEAAAIEYNQTNQVAKREAFLKTIHGMSKNKVIAKAMELSKNNTQTPTPTQTPVMAAETTAPETTAPAVDGTTPAADGTTAPAAETAKEKKARKERVVVTADSAKDNNALKVVLALSNMQVMARSNKFGYFKNLTDKQKEEVIGKTKTTEEIFNRKFESLKANLKSPREKGSAELVAMADPANPKHLEALKIVKELATAYGAKGEGAKVVMADLETYFDKIQNIYASTVKAGAKTKLVFNVEKPIENLWSFLG